MFYTAKLIYVHIFIGVFGGLYGSILASINLMLASHNLI